MTINQQEYAYGDVTVWLFGQPVAGLRGIDYKITQTKEYVRGMGRAPRGIQHGERAVEGTLTILQSEFDALNRSARASGYKDLLDVTFDIVVAYGSTNGVVTVDKICGASIKELPKGMKTSDMFSEHALPFMALDVEYTK
ncbi:MAG TPA: hypothetical protein H9816_04585 [Candidatus Tidjanibacter faecipullorum]|uniref:Phage tail protein n=1 Tax=Candidatus Tidjanibacter faecipullorum TaxID=2838766 RepID=A0A9D2IM23_9BACT|nr:hypothetical protein [Candidatus Tidjanibacter faecipullorum]